MASVAGAQSRSVEVPVPQSRVVGAQNADARINEALVDGGVFCTNRDDVVQSIKKISKDKRFDHGQMVKITLEGEKCNVDESSLYVVKEGASHVKSELVLESRGARKSRVNLKASAMAAMKSKASKRLEEIDCKNLPEVMDEVGGMLKNSSSMNGYALRANVYVEKESRNCKVVRK
ncbi:MAG: hypothetical protein ACE366_26905 [Bradymonadia bacterium]